MIENGAGAVGERGAMGENGAGAIVFEKRSEKKSSTFWCCRLKRELVKQVSYTH